MKKKNRVYAGIDLDALRYNMESMHKKILKKEPKLPPSSRQMLTGMGH